MSEFNIESLTRFRGC